MWRDGAAGKALQKGMVEVAVRRIFSYGILEQSGKVAFASGTAWAAFARLAGPPHFHIDAVMERLFDTRDRWTDSVKALRRLAIGRRMSCSIATFVFPLSGFPPSVASLAFPDGFV